MGDGSEVNLVLQEQRGAITIPSSGVVIGRSSSCFLQVDDPGVSRQHLRISFDGIPLIEDLGSRNGTLVNGERLLGTRALQEGDEIVIGSRCFTVRFVRRTEDSEDTAVTQPVDLGVPPMGTRMGLGAVGGVELSEACPKCGHSVLNREEDCPKCGYSWPTARPRARTLPASPPLQKRKPDERMMVNFQARYASRTLAADGELRSISPKGAFIATNEFDRVGSICMLEIPLDDGSSVVLDGFVQHVIRRGVDQPGMGIEYTNLTTDAEAWLRHVLDQDAGESDR
jgi:pSer/pThr/pTyr-binding forkhead associated (FHA) protein